MVCFHVNQIVHQSHFLCLCCAVQIIGNGDVFNFQDWNKHLTDHRVDTCLVARGALIKVTPRSAHLSVMPCLLIECSVGALQPWLPTEIKKQELWDISSGERFDMLKCGRGVCVVAACMCVWFIDICCWFIGQGLCELWPRALGLRRPRCGQHTSLPAGMAQLSPQVRTADVAQGVLSARMPVHRLASSCQCVVPHWTWPHLSCEYSEW